MQKTKNILAAAFLPLCGLFAQIDTTLREYYPLQVGNYWEYQNSDFPPSKSWTRIVGDTVLPNGKRYFVLMPDYWFIRMDDSLVVWRYYPDPDTARCVEREFISYYKLNAPDKTYWELSCHPGGNPQFKDYFGLWETFTTYYPSIDMTLSTKEFCGVIVDSAGTPTFFSSRIPGVPGTFDLAKGIGLIAFRMEASGTYYLTGAIINGKKYGSITLVGEPTIADSYLELKQNYPNPFNPITTIRYSVPQRSPVLLKVYSLLGQEVRTLVDTEFEAGRYTISFDASDLPSGLYLYRLNAGAFSQTKKMILMR